MKRFIPLLCALGALPALAAPAADAGLAEIRDLGRLNGQALACSFGETAARIKKEMIERAPKSRRYGAIFEEATNESFLAQSKLEPTACPDGPTLNGKVEELVGLLQAALPAGAVK
ncbi:MAG: hypothetical protein PHX38_01105 [Sulfuricella sp.]|nr:hypothetical protein [Sulfuricella sp.]